LASLGVRIIGPWCSTDAVLISHLVHLLGPRLGEGVEVHLVGEVVQSG
jgi:hypothetical protein